VPFEISSIGTEPCFGKELADCFLHSTGYSRTWYIDRLPGSELDAGWLYRCYHQACGCASLGTPPHYPPHGSSITCTTADQHARHPARPVRRRIGRSHPRRRAAECRRPSAPASL